MTREIGIGADITMLENGGNFIDEALGSIIARWPLEPSGFAPYIFGGGGRAFDYGWSPAILSAAGAPTRHYGWLVDFGVGLEYRFNPGTGVFIDGRYVWHDAHNDVDRLLL